MNPSPDRGSAGAVCAPGGPLRVLQLINKFTRRSGPERLAISLVRRLDPARFESHVAQIDFRRFEGASEIEEAVADPSRHLLLPWHRNRLWIDGAARLAGVLRDRRIDVVHCHDIPADLLAVMAVMLHGWLRRPVLLSSRHGYIDYNRKLKLMGWLDNRLLACFDRVFVSSAAMLPTLPPAVGSRAISIVNAVDVDGIPDPAAVAALRTRLDLPAQGKVILALGRLFPEKGHCHLVAALPALLARNPGLRLVIVGEGPLRDALRSQAAALGVGGSLVLAGFLDDARPAYQLCDVFVQPSVSESFPLTVFEAMAWAKPVVAARVGGLAEHLRDGETARLVAPADPGALAGAVGDLLADDAVRCSLARSGRAQVVEHYSDRAYARDTGAWYERLVLERHASPAR